MANKGILNIVKQILKNIGYFSLGFVASILIVLYCIVSLPILLYRWIICSLLRPLYPSHIIKPVSIPSIPLSCEFLKSKSHLPPRATIVMSYVKAGKISMEFVKSSVTSKWIEVKNSNGEIKYPELQYYIGEWLGFMFWKREEFHLDNHIFSHEIDPNSSVEESEKFGHDLMEQCLNEKYTERRSPWQFHVVHNYKSRDTIGKTETATLFIFRSHHALTDGISMLSLFCEPFFNMPLKNIRKMHQTKSTNKSLSISFSKLLTLLKLPFRFCRDLGFGLYPVVINEHSPFYIADKDKSWKQIYEVSPIIPLDKIKTIRKKFGVNFTSIFLAAAGTATGKYMERKGKAGRCRKLHFGSLLPLPDHPEKLVNHASATFFEVDTSPNQDVIRKLMDSDESLLVAKHSTLPHFVPLNIKLTSFTLAEIVSKLTFINFVSIGLSNFPGSTERFYWKGDEILTSHFVTGCASGVVGVGMQILGYVDQIRFVVAADTAVLSRTELHEFTQLILQEIDKMFDAATKTEEKNGNRKM